MASFTDIVQDVYDRGLSVDRFNELKHNALFGSEEAAPLFKMDNIMEKPKPNKVQKIFCKNCKELLMKLYPWAGEVRMPPEGVVCRKCAYKQYQKQARSAWRY